MTAILTLAAVAGWVLVFALLIALRRAWRDQDATELALICAIGAERFLKWREGR